MAEQSGTRVTRSSEYRVLRAQVPVRADQEIGVPFALESRLEQSKSLHRREGFLQCFVQNGLPAAQEKWGFTFPPGRRSLRTMSTAGEIEAAIRTLSPTERKKLVRVLPALLPELDGDEAWKRIMDDPAPSPALSAFVDAIDVEHQRNPDTFREIKDSDFDTRP